MMLRRQGASMLSRPGCRLLQTMPRTVQTPSQANSASSAQPSAAKEWASHSLPRMRAPLRTPMRNAPASAPRTAPAAESKPAAAAAQQPAKTEVAKPAAKPRRVLRPRKAAITLTPTAVDHLKALLDSPTPKLIRVGVRNRGCSGLTYHLEYVDKPGKFDEEVTQDGVKVLIDSKALFSIIGSEMDWIDDKLTSRFVFHNPNSKGQCGCGESFMV